MTVPPDRAIQTGRETPAHPAQSPLRRGGHQARSGLAACGLLGVRSSDSRGKPENAARALRDSAIPSAREGLRQTKDLAHRHTVFWGALPSTVFRAIF